LETKENKLLEIFIKKIPNSNKTWNFFLSEEEGSRIFRKMCVKERKVEKVLNYRIEMKGQRVSYLVIVSSAFASSFIALHYEITWKEKYMRNI